MQQQFEPLAFSIRQTAHAAQVSETFIRAVIRTGKLRAVKLGRCWRIPRSEILRLCGETKQPTGKRQAKKR